MQTQDTSKLKLILISTALVLLAFIAYEPVRYNDFVNYDDNTYISKNVHIQSGFTQESIAWAFTSGYAANWHPLTWLSHMLDIELFGLNPLGHHFHNLLLHTISTILLFWLLYKMTGSVWCSAFTAMVFGIHPLHVESVAWASERKDVLSALFWMITLAAYLYYARRGGVLRYLLVLFCFALGLMAKPMVVSLPIVLFFLDFWPLKRIQKNIGRLIAEKIPLIILALAACIITYQVQQAGGSVLKIASQAQPTATDVVQTEGVPLGIRVSNAMMSYVAYLGKMMWPARLGVLYPYPTRTPPIWQPFLLLIVLVLCTVFAVFRYFKNPYLFVGWFWYGITLIPVIGLIQVGAQAMADRYMYLPSIGITILLSWGIAELTVKLPGRKIILGILIAAIALGMTATTRAQTTYWKDTVILFKHTLDVTKDNALLYCHLGIQLENQDKPDEAIEYFNKAIQLWPDFLSPNLHLGELLIKRKQYKESIPYLNKVLEVSPNYPIAHVNIGMVLAALGENDAAVKAFEQAIKLDSRCVTAYVNMATVKTQQGLTDEAIQDLRQSIQIYPTAEAYFNLGFILEMKGEIKESISSYRNALTFEPGDFQTLWHLACCLHETGNLQEAVKIYNRVLQIEPNFPEALGRMAWILATVSDDQLRNTTEAVSLAQKACRMTDFSDPIALDTLAVAYAATGQFKEAVETAQKALDLAKSAGRTDMAQEIEKGLKLYQAEKPYVDPSSK
jgi:tetratricopeptide (TPR) repeat protein